MDDYLKKNKPQSTKTSSYKSKIRQKKIEKKQHVQKENLEDFLEIRTKRKEMNKRREKKMKGPIEEGQYPAEGGTM